MNRLLHQVLGVVHRAEHPVAVREQFPPVRIGLLQEVDGLGFDSHHVLLPPVMDRLLLAQ
nr:hypothetical protein [Kibdelosporangium philippinense]